MNPRGRRRHACAVLALVVGLVLAPLAPAVAEGPGYGGTAAGLDVRWEATTIPGNGPSAPAPTSSTARPTSSAPAPSAPTSSGPARSTPASAPTATTPSTLAPSTASSPAAGGTDPTSAGSSSSSGGATTPAQPDASVTTTASGLPRVSLSASGGGRGAAAHVRGGALLAAAADAASATQPQIQQDVLDLTVRGLGFRARSAVTVRLGGAESVVVRADTAGSLAVAIDGTQLQGTDPGVSVMAVGRNPSGTEVVLLGSVPPTPGGTGPMTLVPWAALLAALTGLAVWTARPAQRAAQPVGRHARS